MPESKTKPTDKIPEKNNIVDDTFPNSPKNIIDPSTPNTQIP